MTEDYRTRPQSNISHTITGAPTNPTMQTGSALR
jgi:hypothetical protein